MDVNYPGEVNFDLGDGKGEFAYSEVNSSENFFTYALHVLLFLNLQK
jgi:hypothetical protein